MRHATHDAQKRTDPARARTGPVSATVRARPAPVPSERDARDDRLAIACKAVVVSWLVSDGNVLASAEVAEDRISRRRGLLGRDGFEGALVITRCGWVHTIGMRFPLDVAYVDDDGIVLKTLRMKRHRVGIPVHRARAVIEAEAGAFARWGVHVGDLIEIRE